MWELPGSDDFYEMVTEYYKESTKLKVYQRGVCDEYDAKDRMIPFKGCFYVIFHVIVKMIKSERDMGAVVSARF